MAVFNPIDGTANSEVLTGTAGDDHIRGFGGDDTLHGMGAMIGSKAAMDPIF